MRSTRYCGVMTDTGSRYRAAGAAVDTVRSDIVTGEGVGLVLPTVSFGSRVLSAAIDWTIYVLLGSAAWYVVERTWQPSNAAQEMTWVTTLLLLWAVGLPFLVQYVTRGSSPGRLATGTRTVREDGGTIAMRHAATRSVAGLFDGLFTLGALGAVTIAVTRRGQRTGDLLAGTIVVRWSRASRRSQPFTIDPALAEWARVATVRPLPGPLAIATRDYVRARGTMTSEARTGRARDLASAIEACVAPPPPLGTDPDAFMTTVLALRERLDFQRERARMTDHARTEGKLSALPYGMGQD